MSRCRTLAAVIAAGCALIPIADAGAATRAFGSRTLAEPMRGPDVRTLQRLLTRWGLPTGADGQFGARTGRSVRAWERHAGRRVDGRVSRREAVLLRSAVARGERGPAAVPQAPATAAPVEKATLRSDGLAVAPASAPAVVKAIIAAGNEIAHKPYKYGGGHGRWRDSGYDCSGSMSYALHGAGLLDTALDSSGFARWGQAGRGEWVTIYANAGHSYMLVAGLRFDTSGLASDGSRWHASGRSSAGYTVRHPAGL